MIKKFAPLTLLFGLLTALLLGSASTAQATPLIDFTCNNVVGVGVVCQNTILNNIKITVADNHTLNGTQIATLENSLNGTAVLNNSNFLNDLRANTLSVYNNNFYIPINVSNISFNVASCTLNILSLPVCV